jgi:phosphoglycerol transferase
MRPTSLDPDQPTRTRFPQTRPSRTDVSTTARWSVLAVWRSVGAYLTTAILSLVAVGTVLELWGTDLHVPFMYERDALYNLLITKTTIQFGWPLENPLIASPHGGEFYDFPTADWLNFALLRVIGGITGDAVVTANVFFIVTFPLVAITSLWALVRIGLSTGAAIACSVVYATLPYHFNRGINHMFLSAYYAIPLVAWFVVDAWRQGGQHGRESERRFLVLNRRGVFVACAVGVVVGSSGIYYAFFGSMLLGFVSIACILRQRCFATPAKMCCLLMVTISAAVLANLSPTIAYDVLNGRNAEVAQRVPLDAQTYGLTINQLLLPIPQHRIAFLAALRENYDSTNLVQRTETQYAVLGLFSSLGFVLLLASTLRWWKGRAASWDALAALNLAAVLFGTVGGFASLFATFVTPEIRAPNRISVYIAFFSVAASGLALDALRARLPLRRSYDVAWLAVVSGLVVLAVADQTSAKRVPQAAIVAREFASDDRFVHSIESEVGAGARVYQLPLVDFPEGAPVLAVGSYDGFRGYLHSDTLRWSNGAIRGRTSEWHRQLVDEPMGVFLQRLAALQFSGIYVDRVGYGDSARSLEGELSAQLGPATVISTNERLAFYSMLPFDRTWIADHSAESRGQLRTFSLESISVSWGGAFSIEERKGEKPWHRARGAGELSLTNPLDVPRRVRLECTLLGSDPQKPLLVISGDLMQQSLGVGTDEVAISETIVVPPGIHTVRFASEAVAGVDAHGVPRQSTFRVGNLTVTDELFSPAVPADASHGEAPRVSN